MYIMASMTVLLTTSRRIPRSLGVISSSVIASPESSLSNLNWGLGRRG